MKETFMNTEQFPEGGDFPDGGGTRTREAEIKEETGRPGDTRRTGRYVPDSATYSEAHSDDPERAMMRRWDELRRLKERGTPVEGTVISAIPVPSQDRVNIMTSALGFSVVIPDYEFFSPGSFSRGFEDATVREKAQRRLEKARAALGARISFIIMGMAAGREGGSHTFTVAASRTRAMQAKQRYYFGGDGPRVREGDLVDANVISVGEHFANLEACGAECIVNPSEIDAYRYISDCRDALSPGDTLRVTVKRIHRDASGAVRLNVSGSAAGNARMGADISKLKKGAAHLGTVRNYSAKGGIYTAVLDCGALVSVDSGSVIGGEILQGGDRITVVVTNVTPGMAWGTAKRLGGRKTY